MKVSGEFKAELEIRLKEFEEIPESSLTWDQVKSILTDGSWRLA